MTPLDRSDRPIPVMLRRAFVVAAVAVQICSGTKSARAAGPAGSGPPIMGEPDYGTWNRLLAAYYDPAHGMDYAHLKANDAKVFALWRVTRNRRSAAGIGINSLDVNIG